MEIVEVLRDSDLPRHDEAVWLPELAFAQMLDEHGALLAVALVLVEFVFAGEVLVIECIVEHDLLEHVLQSTRSARPTPSSRTAAHPDVTSRYTCPSPSLCSVSSSPVLAPPPKFSTSSAPLCPRPSTGHTSRLSPTLRTCYPYSPSSSPTPSL